MLPILFVGLLIHQTPQLAVAATNAQIVSAFQKALQTSFLQKTLQGQLTVLAKNGEDVKLHVYNYRTIFGKVPLVFRSESQLTMGVEAKQHRFLTVSDGEDFTVYNQTKNIYMVSPTKEATQNPPPIVGLATAICLLSQKSTKPLLAVPDIADSQAAKEALSIFPMLFAQQGLLSGGTRQELDGRYSLFVTAKTEGMSEPAVFTLTLSMDQSYIQRIRVEFHPADTMSLTLTEVVTQVTTTSVLPKFTFDVPRRAKKVKELPPLLDSL